MSRIDSLCVAVRTAAPDLYTEWVAAASAESDEQERLDSGEAIDGGAAFVAASNAEADAREAIAVALGAPRSLGEGLGCAWPPSIVHIGDWLTGPQEDGPRAGTGTTDAAQRHYDRWLGIRDRAREVFEDAALHGGPAAHGGDRSPAEIARDELTYAEEALVAAREALARRVAT